MDRFGNLSLEQLLERDREARADIDALRKAIEARLLAECPIKIGKVYRFGAGEAVLPWKRGKEFLVCSLRVDNFASFLHVPRYAVGIHGFNALKRSTAGDGFGIKASVLQSWRLLDLSSERDGPRPELVEFARKRQELLDA